MASCLFVLVLECGNIKVRPRGCKMFISIGFSKDGNATSVISVQIFRHCPQLGLVLRIEKKDHVSNQISCFALTLLDLEIDGSDALVGSIQ